MTSVRDGATDLYRFYDAGDRLLYVGISFSAIQRAAQHREDKPWWPRVASMTVDHLPSRDLAERMERLAIATEDPTYNINRPGGSLDVRRVRVGNNHIIIVDAFEKKRRWGHELIVPMCPGCGAKHTHGITDTERRLGFASRFPHCWDGAWMAGRSDFYDIPWQVLRVRRAKSDGSHRQLTESDHERRWLRHRQFRQWSARAIAPRLVA